MTRSATPLARRTAALVAVVLAPALLGAACSSGGESASSTSTTSTTAPAAKCTPPDTGTPTSTPVAGSSNDLDVAGSEGTTIRAHWYPRPGASASAPSPTVLMGPGWGLSGDTDVSAVGFLGANSIGNLHTAGYNVLTWDPRGFGKSAGTATVNDKDNEGRDVQRLISFVASRPEVQLDAAGDPRMGMVGASYGGGIQLVTAATDCRVDAIVPIIAWNSLETSLYKGKVPKTGWAGILTGVSALGKVDPHLPTTKASADATGTISDEDADWFRSRGPGRLVDDVRVPTLIVQGTVDTLFTLDEGIRNYSVIDSNKVPVAMVWFCGGHGVCNADPGDPERIDRRIVSWLDRYVRRDRGTDTGPGFDMVDQDGVRYTAPAWPVAKGDSLTATGEGTLRLVAEGGSAGAAGTAAENDVIGPLAERIMPGVASNAVDVKVPFGSRDALVVGAPQLSLTYSGTTGPGPRPQAVFAQLVDDNEPRRVIGQQVTPVPLVLDGKEHQTQLPLEVVAFHARPGGSLTLQIVATTSGYATPRLGGEVEFSRIALKLPVATGLRQTN